MALSLELSGILWWNFAYTWILARSSSRDCQMPFVIGRAFAEVQILKKVKLALSLEPFRIQCSLRKFCIHINIDRSPNFLQIFFMKITQRTRCTISLCLLSFFCWSLLPVITLYRSPAGDLFVQKINLSFITVKILNIRTPQKFAVITLRFEQGGFTKE